MKYFLLFVKLVLVGIICLFSYLFYVDWKDYKEGDDDYRELAEQVIVEDNQPVLNIEVKDPVPTIDYDALYKINSDFVGWIRIPDTIINYPIVQGKDNTYYLEHLFNHKKVHSATLFMDCDNHKNFKDDCTLIYGHHMKNGSMFAELEKFYNPKWLKAFQERDDKIHIYTKKKIYTLQPFSAFRFMPDEPSLKNEFTSQEQFQEYVDWIIHHKGGIQIHEYQGGRIVGLQTCDYTDKRGVGRLIVFNEIVQVEDNPKSAS